ncbi:MAG: hypothetical protein ABSG88_22760 [Bradyrhizobium sp.]
MKLADTAVWTIAVIVALIAYVCVAMAVWMIWPLLGRVMLGLAVGVICFFPVETWLVMKVFLQRRETVPPVSKPPSVG